MPFLRINGWTIPVANATPTHELTVTGRRDRSHRGQLRSSERFHRRRWNVKAVVKDHDDAHSIEGLVAGRAQFFDLADGLQAATGLMPLPPGAIGGATILPGTTGAFGDGVLSVPAATVGTVVAWDAQIGAEWTVMFMRSVAGDFLGHAVRSDGSSYVDGAASSTFGHPAASGGDGVYVRVTDGVAEIVKDGTAADEIFDDVSILSYRASDSMLEQVTQEASLGLKFGPAPFVRCDGDLVGASSIICRGTVSGTEIVTKPSRLPLLGWVNNARIVSFTLEEVDPLFFAESA